MTTVLTSYSLLPELQHYFHNFVVSSQVNRDIVPLPVDITEVYMPQNSFIELLFNDSYSGTSYEYRYVDETSLGSIPVMSQHRLQIYPASWKYLTIDSSGTNIFNLQNDDFTLLDALLEFRNGASDSTSLVLVDSISTSFVSDTTANIYTLYANYGSLSTTLSKLIYLYLRLETLGDFSLYNNDLLVSSGSLLESCFEAYLLDKYFIFMTQREPSLIYECQCD